MKTLICLCLLLFSSSSYSQTCERFERRLFHFLPKYVPDTINCTDANGKKQGWWIYYEVDYNPTPRPSVLDSGNYVESYRYGQYQDNKMIGKWIHFQNVHLCYEERTDSFYYNKDTVGVYTDRLFLGCEKTLLEYIHDSTIINATVIQRRDTVCIYCEKTKKNKNKACKMTRDDELIKEFPFQDFEFNYLTAIEQIRNDRKIKKRLSR